MGEELRDYQDPDSWDEGEIQHPIKRPRAIVSVAFSREDFEKVAEQARQRGLKTSEFIRKAALDGVAGKRPEPVSITVTGPVHTVHPKLERSRSRATVTLLPSADDVYTT